MSLLSVIGHWLGMFRVRAWVAKFGSLVWRLWGLPGCLMIFDSAARKWVKHISAFGSDMSCIKYKLLYYLFDQFVEVSLVSSLKLALHVFHLFSYPVST